MNIKSHPQIYQEIGNDYANQRVPDARIAAQIDRALVGTESVCNVGAGTGSYEPLNRVVRAVEPSALMIGQRTSKANVVQAKAESLPFSDKEFDAAMAVLTVHHWTDQIKGLEEMARVAKRQVVLTFDPRMVDSFWLVKDYFPQIGRFDEERFLPIETVCECFAAARVEVVPIPWNCTDGFQAAYWRRPEEYLEPSVRQSMSTFAMLPSSQLDAGLKDLKADVQSGAWKRSYCELLDCQELDLGYRLVIGEQSEKP